MAAFFRAMINSVRNQGYTKNQKIFIVEGIFTNIMTVFTTASFLTGFLVSIGMSDYHIGLMSTSATWSSIIALASIFLYQKMRRVKPFLVTIYVISKALLCFIVIVPFILGASSVVQNIVMLMIVAGYILTAVYNVGYNVWLMNSIERHNRTQYVYDRMFYIRIFYLIALIVSGFLMDSLESNPFGFLIIFLSGFAFSLVSFITMLRADESVNLKPRTHRISFREFIMPFRDKPYLKFLCFIFLYYICLTTSSCFTGVFLLKYLGISYIAYSGMNILTFIAQILTSKFWSRIERERGALFVIKVSGLIAVSEFLFYGFMTHTTLFFLFLTPFLSGIGNSGYGVAIFTYRYELMPETNNEPYEAWFNGFYGLATLLAPMIGNFLCGLLPDFQNAVYEFSDFQILYLASFICATLVVLLLIKPKKSDKDKQKQLK